MKELLEMLTEDVFLDLAHRIVGKLCGEDKELLGLLKTSYS